MSAMKVMKEMDSTALVSVLKNPKIFIAIYSIQFTIMRHFSIPKALLCVKDGCSFYILSKNR